MASSVVPWADYDGSQVEDLVAAWLVRTMPGAQRIDGAGGDDGVDVRVPVEGGYHVYSIKGFHSRLAANQKRQIRESLKTAVQRQPAMVRWTLVLPLDLTPAEDRWFVGTLTGLAEVPMDWIGRTPLEAGLSQHRDLLRAFAPGSTERRAMDLLGEYHAEQAAMSRGMVDGVERLARLKAQLDLTDPDWAFDVEIAGDNINVELRPKDHESASRRPLGVAFEIDSANDSAVAAALDQFLRYGRPTDIPSQNITRFAADLPGNLGEVITQGGTPSLSIQKSDDEKAWRLAQRIEALRGGLVIATLPVEWDDRSRGPLGGSWLSGRDRSGFLELIMRVEPNLKGGLEIRAQPNDNLLPEDAVPVLRFLAALRPGDRLRGVAPDFPAAEARISGDIEGQEPGMAESRLVVAETLARIQSAIGIRFALPGEWNDQDREMLYFCDQLLSNGQVQWYWPGYSFNLPAGRVAELLSKSVLPRISMSGTSGENPSIDLMGHRISMPGRIRCEVTDMIVLNPRVLADQIRNMPPGAPVEVPLGQDDRTLSMFFLDRNSGSDQSEE